ncbi:MAG TPA: YciI family protein [Ktedonobacterales bacterium]|nr:YciI family protein [Ktedonobacterales bacterium]
MTTLYLILLTYVRPTEEVTAHVEEHRAYLRRAYAEGHFIVSGPRAPATGGVILARAASEEGAWDLIRVDPFYQQGIAEYQVIAFDALWSAPDFAALLAPLPPTQAGQGDAS